MTTLATAPTPPNPTLLPNVDIAARTWRPSPVDAYRNDDRSGHAWILRQLGMGEAVLDRSATGGFADRLKELAVKADEGDHSAIESLGWLAWRCSSARSEDQINSYQKLQLQDASLLSSADTVWFKSYLT